MKRHPLLAKLFAAFLSMIILISLLPSACLHADAASKGKCPANISTYLFNSNNFISVNGNEASRTQTFCTSYHLEKIIMKSLDPSIATVSYKTAGTVKNRKVLFVSIRYKKVKDVMIAMNNGHPDSLNNIPTLPTPYRQELASFTIGSKKYGCKKSFSYTGSALKNKKVTVKPQKGLSVKCLYVVDNYEWVKKNTSSFSVKKKYKNGAKVTVPNGCSLHAVLTSGGSAEPDFCIYTANGSTSGTSSSSSSSSSSSGAPAQCSITKTFKNPTGSYAIQWKTVKGADGYQVDVASDKAFTKPYTRKYDSTTYGCSTNIASSVKISYFRVRAFKEANGKTVYGKWSAVKSITTN